MSERKNSAGMQFLRDQRLQLDARHRAGELTLDQKVALEVIASRLAIATMVTRDILMGNGDANLIYLWEHLNEMPAEAEVSKGLPQGNFWVIGPNAQGRCFVYSPETELVTLHSWREISQTMAKPSFVFAKYHW
jgi:hypothetical protein